jgi:LmbE family N-acetylglucosaminyl deacetylase
VQDVRPDVIVTFGPDGMTGHPDERVVSAWTTEAWRRTGREPELWYASGEPDAEDAVSLRLTDPLLARKRRALRASCGSGLRDLMDRAHGGAWWFTERFVAAERLVYEDL